MTILDQAMYAVVGGCCVGGAATKTVSTVIIVYELTGQVALMMPVMIGLCVAILASNGVTQGIFDIVMEFKNFPFMPGLGNADAYNMKASDIMNKNFLYVTKATKVRDIPTFLHRIGPIGSVTIPVLESEAQKYLLFTISSKSLRKYLYEHYKS